ncbi:MAG: immunity 17 family protein [Spirochaetales bacterium]|nr:immunity 17 family protein [Spirochaetales bacterium]
MKIAAGQTAVQITLAAAAMLHYTWKIIPQVLQGGNMIYYGIAFILIGAFSLAAGIFNWDWFMKNRRAQFFVRVFKRTGARIFYGVLGLAAITIGILYLTGVISTE